MFEEHPWSCDAGSKSCHWLKMLLFSFIFYAGLIPVICLLSSGALAAGVFIFCCQASTLKENLVRISRFCRLYPGAVLRAGRGETTSRTRGNRNCLIVLLRNQLRSEMCLVS